MIRRKKGSKLTPRQVRARNRKALIRELDQLAREAVFERDDYRCIWTEGGERCPETRGIQWAHVDSRRFLATRWSMVNGMTLCQKHHFYWHDRPVEAGIWFGQRYSHRHASIVRARSTEPDLEAIRDELLTILGRKPHLTPRSASG